MRIIPPIIVIILALPFRLAAQDVSETLGDVAEPYARAYARPLADAAGATLSSGLFHTARAGTELFSFDVYIGVRATGMLLHPSDQSFDLTYRDTTQLTQTVGPVTRTMGVPATFTTEEAPTIFGPAPAGASTVTVRHDTTVSYLGVLLPVSLDTTFTKETVGGLVETDIAPLAVPHLQLGTLFGTDLTVRWSPPIEVADVGTAQLRGLGIRHSVSQYTPRLPFELAVQATWQAMNLQGEREKEYIEVSTRAVNLQISKRTGLLTIYGGFQMEESIVDIGYLIPVDGDETRENDGSAYTSIALSLHGATRMRGTAGLTLHLGPLTVNADVSRGHRTMVTAGMGIAF
jgi:hypothetical protein